MTPNLKPKKKKPLAPAHIAHGSEPAAFTSGDVAAIQALRTGTANEGQQQRALDWIINSASGATVWPYRESQRETDIALGRQMVGQQIIGLLKINLSALRQYEERGEPNG